MFQTQLPRKSVHTFCVQIFRSENRVMYEIMCKNKVEADRPPMTIEWQEHTHPFNI